MRHYPILVLLLITFTLPAQQTVTPTFDTITVEFDVWDEPYLFSDQARDTSRESYQDYAEGNVLSFSGYTREATRHFEEQMSEMEMDTVRYDRFRDSFHATPAVASILADAEQHEIVIVNEAHHEPRHRVFTRGLLQGLYDRGYRHFGMETLAYTMDMDSTVNAATYPALNAGYYTRDPQFAAMVAEAQRIGFRLFGYEASGTGSPALREQGQMENIMEYRANYPGDKLLLHVGYAHAMEGELGGAWERAMAQRLADTTGLDPLTIDQTKFREMVDTVREQYEYRHFAATETSVFVNDDGEHFNFDNEIRGMDRYVFHPRTTYAYGRPDYVYSFDRQPVVVDFGALEGHGPWLARVYGTDDDMTKAVPRDVVEVSREESVALALSAGEYILLITDREGSQWVGEISIE